MYLSELELDITSPSVRQALRNCHDMHKNIMKAFGQSRRDARVLYRVMKTDARIAIYVQSETEPQWNLIAANGYFCTRIQDISALLDKFTDGSLLRFSVLACPSKKMRGDGRNSRRVLLKTADERMEWLKRQGDKHGFLVLEAYEAASHEKVFGIRKPSGEFFLSGVPFEGILRIADADTFRKDFPCGIGAEKAYGFGLLMIARA